MHAWCCAFTVLRSNCMRMRSTLHKAQRKSTINELFKPKRSLAIPPSQLQRVCQRINVRIKLHVLICLRPEVREYVLRITQAPLAHLRWDGPTRAKEVA